MPVVVSMHACSVWPVNIDFDVFRFFLKGYSVEETVEQLMALQSVAEEKPLTRQQQQQQRLTSSSSEPAAAPSGERSSDSSLSPSLAVPVPTRERRSRHRTRDATGRKNKGRRSTSLSAEAALQAAESALLTEDRRATAEGGDAGDELPASAAQLRRVATPVGDVGPHTPTAPVTTAVDTSTNSARRPYRASASSRTAAAAAALSAGHDAASGRTHSQQHASSQPPPVSGHNAEEPSHHSHRHRSHHHHHHADRSHVQTSSHQRRSRHAVPSRSTSLQPTASGSATNTASASFALPPMYSQDSMVGTPYGAAISPAQHIRHSSTTLSFDNGTFVDAAASRLAGSVAQTGPHTDTNANNNNSNSIGPSKPSSAENRQRANRQKRRKERQCFYLNEDYIKFQRQLQEVEAVGSVGMGASSLQSRYLFEEVTEQFQAFRELAQEEQLGSPYAFLSNYYVPIPVSMRLELLQLYYETDPGVFRWAFGDKLNRFDLPGALAAVRDELLSSTVSSSAQSKSIFGASPSNNNLVPSGGNGSMLGLNSSVHAASNATGSGGGGSSFWNGRWKSSPGKLATMDAATLVRLGEQHTEALRRQWDNVKHVCVTVAALYRGKGGMCVPLDMPLLTTIQQVFALRHGQALDYATAAFGYEHRLETRLFDRLHTFSEYGAICTVVASLWCDASGYFLSEPFRAGCRRIGRLLDEYRFLSELHPFLFGEPMRPRWQVQLDEVQRVITTSSLVEKNAVASATAVAAGSPVGAAGVAANNGSGSATGGGSGGGGGGGGGAAMGGSGGGAGGASGGSGSGPGSGGPNNSSSLGAAAGGWDNYSSSPTAAGTTNANVHSPLSGNGQYSRRFLMEFPSLMKHLLRVCAALGNNSGVNDALDIFFTRIYSYLEVLSARSAPAIVNMVMSATASGGFAAGPPAAHGSFAGAGLHGSGGAGAPGLAGRPPLPPSSDSRPRSHTDLTRAGGSARASPPPQVMSGPTSPLRAGGGGGGGGGMSRVMSTPVLSTSASKVAAATGAAATARHGSPLAMHGTGSFSESRAPSSAAEDVLVPGSSVPYAASAVVNTSLFHPASALIPLSAAIAAQNAAAAAGGGAAHSTSSPLSAMAGGWRSFAAEEEDASSSQQQQQWVADGSGGPQASVTSSSAANGGAGTTSAHLTSQVSEMVRKAVDKRYLRELCMLLAALPVAWRQLTVLPEEDHAVTDQTMTDLAMALKAITQVLMASDDFH